MSTCNPWWKGVYDLRYYCKKPGDIIPSHWNRECKSACNKPDIPLTVSLRTSPYKP